MAATWRMGFSAREERFPAFLRSSAVHGEIVALVGAPCRPALIIIHWRLLVALGNGALNLVPVSLAALRHSAHAFALRQRRLYPTSDDRLYHENPHRRTRHETRRHEIHRGSR